MRIRFIVRLDDLAAPAKLLGHRPGISGPRDPLRAGVPRSMSTAMWPFIHAALAGGTAVARNGGKGRDGAERSGAESGPGTCRAVAAVGFPS
jgi:hypothetical protein